MMIQTDLKAEREVQNFIKPKQENGKKRADGKQKTPLIVLKFGSSVLKTEEDLKNVVHEVYAYLRKGYKVIAVVSAMGNDTNLLINQAQRVYNHQNNMIPMLIRLGEFRSAALLSMALLKIGIKATALDPIDIDLRAHGRHMNANLVSVNHQWLENYLRENEALIIPGYVALNKKRDYVTLGRGGTDLTAIFLGIEMKAEKIHLIKDVDGVYREDPNKKTSLNLHPLKEINWKDAREINKGVIQKKALIKAENNQYPVSVGALARNYETIIGLHNMDALFEDKYRKFKQLKQKKIKLTLAGCGTVGFGVYQHCLRHSDFFEIRHILVKNKEKHSHIPNHILTSDPEDINWAETDLFIELMGGLNPAYELINKALDKRISVVSANKQLIAEYYDELTQKAEQKGVNLFYSAAVGGGVPILESLDNARKKNKKITEVIGVVNGTTNFVLDQYLKGMAFETAIQKAQQAGFAEADPSMDINGGDAAAKLSIIARHAFKQYLPISVIQTQPLSELTHYDLKELKKKRKRLRHIARCFFENGVIKGEVRLQALNQKSFLSKALNEDNRMIIKFSDGTEKNLSGKGAGCWPTSEAVMADLFDCLRSNEEKEL